MADRRADVFLDSGEEPLGHISVPEQIRPSCTFQYSSAWIRSPRAFAIDPRLPLVSGPQTSVEGLFGCFSDSAPDQWGRGLLYRLEMKRAREAEDRPRTLTEADYLFGVSDLGRQGALRFKQPDEKEYLSDRDDSVPLVTELGGLLRAVDEIQDGDLTHLRQIAAAGAGTGGARPKASITDGADLWLAKFRQKGDDRDVEAWEKITNTLASRAGIDVPETRLVSVDSASILLIRRFDRAAPRRLPYMSAMSLLQAHEGEVGEYLDIAEEMAVLVAEPAKDLEQLWRRIAFSVAVNNTDDHLRNHGFVRRDGRWTLSPAFDVNPDPNLWTPSATSVFGETERDLRLAALIQSADQFRVPKKRVPELLTDIAGAVGGWRALASEGGVRPDEIDRMAEVFESGLSIVSSLT